MKDKEFTPTIVLSPLSEKPVLSTFVPTGTYYDFLIAQEKLEQAKLDFKQAEADFAEAFRKFHGYEPKL